MSRKLISRFSQVAAAALSVLLLLACDNPSSNVIVVTEIVEVEGGTRVVTRLVEQTIEVPVTTIPVAPAAAAAEPVVLDISMSEAELPRLDPQLTLDEEALDLVENLFVGLTRQNYQNARIEPSLATSWQVSSDRRTWTFRLRDDVYWVHATEDGQVERRRQVTAADVVYAFRRACDSRTNTPYVFILYVIDGCEAVNRAPDAAAVDMTLLQVSAEDAQTVVVRLTRPANHFLALTALWTLRPLPAEIIEEYEAEWDMPANIWTNGPFVLSRSSVSGRQTSLLRNPFWPLPFDGNVDVVNIFHIDEDAAYDLWREKALDVAPVPAAMRETVMSEIPQRFTLVSEQQVFYLAYNFDSPVFSLPEMRRAFGAAIDRARLIEEVYGGLGVPLRHFTPEGVVGAPRRDEIGTGYNADYARQQLADGPFRDCRLMPPIRYLVSASDIELQQAELIRQMWADELKCPQELIQLEQVQFGTLLAQTRADAGTARPDVWHLGWASYYPDAHNWLGDVLHCIQSENRERRPCSAVDEQIEAAEVTASPDERWEIYREVERAFFAQDGIEPLTPLYARARQIMVHPWLQYAPATFGGEQYDRYRVDWTAKQLERTQ